MIGHSEIILPTGAPNSALKFSENGVMRNFDLNLPTT
jgi:hypothetical protein